MWHDLKPMAVIRAVTVTANTVVCSAVSMHGLNVGTHREHIATD